jgi:HTH-type transcriptional regulator / antitoxin MqsA
VFQTTIRAILLKPGAETMINIVKDSCRICGDGQLELRSEKNSVEYNGISTELDLLYSVCDHCGSEQSSSQQLRNNKRAMVEFRKKSDELLTGKEIRAIREKLGLSQAQAALVFGGGPVAFSKYESDDVTQSEAMDKLIRLAAELSPAYEYLVQRAGLDKHVA